MTFYIHSHHIQLEKILKAQCFSHSKKGNLRNVCRRSSSAGLFAHKREHSKSPLMQGKQVAKLQLDLMSAAAFSKLMSRRSFGVSPLPKCIAGTPCAWPKLSTCNIITCGKDNSSTRGGDIVTLINYDCQVINHAAQGALCHPWELKVLDWMKTDNAKQHTIFMGLQCILSNNKEVEMMVASQHYDTTVHFRQWNTREAGCSSAKRKHGNR